MNECNLSIDRDFIQLQNMLSNMDQRQREKFTEDTCGMPHSIFSIVNLYPFLNELRKSPALIGKISILMLKLEFAIHKTESTPISINYFIFVGKMPPPSALGSSGTMSSIVLDIYVIRIDISIIITTATVLYLSFSSTFDCPLEK